MAYPTKAQKIYAHNHRAIMNSVINGRWKEALELISEGCRTKPYEMARRVYSVLDDLNEQGLYLCAFALKRHISEAADKE